MNSKHEIPASTNADFRRIWTYDRDMEAELEAALREKDGEWWIRLGKFRKALHEANLHGHYNLLQEHFQDEANKWESLQSQLTEARSQIEGLKHNFDYFQQRIFDALGSSIGKPPWEKIADLKAQLASVGKGVTDEDDKQPCPWCGNIDTFLAIGRSEIGYHEECEECGARGPHVRVRQESTAAWNKRLATQAKQG